MAKDKLYGQMFLNVTSIGPSKNGKEGTDYVNGLISRFGTEPDEKGKVPADLGYRYHVTKDTFDELVNTGKCFKASQKGEDGKENLALIFPQGTKLGTKSQSHYAVPILKTMENAPDAADAYKDPESPFYNLRQAKVFEGIKKVTAYKAAQAAAAREAKGRELPQTPIEPAAEAEAQPEM